jgi:pimeloyl-ACP methyl ester carboxylesterase
VRREWAGNAETAAFAHYGLAPRPRELSLAGPPLRVRALADGAGEPLLLLHGLSLGAVHWAPLLARLDGAWANAIDMPGHGGTDGIDFDGTDLRRWHTRFLLGCLEALGLDSAHIVGHSYGGMFGLWLALDEPNRVRSVVSIGAPSIALGARPDITFRTLARPRVGPLALRCARPLPRDPSRPRSGGTPCAARPGRSTKRVFAGPVGRGSPRLRRATFASSSAAPPPPRRATFSAHASSPGSPARVLFLWGERDTR